MKQSSYYLITNEKISKNELAIFINISYKESTNETFIQYWIMTSKSLILGGKRPGVWENPVNQARGNVGLETISCLVQGSKIFYDKYYALTNPEKDNSNDAILCSQVALTCKLIDEDPSNEKTWEIAYAVLRCMMKAIIWSPETKRSVYTFPWIESHSSITKNINDNLQRHNCENKKAAYEDVWLLHVKPDIEIKEQEIKDTIAQVMRLFLDIEDDPKYEVLVKYLQQLCRPENTWFLMNRNSKHPKDRSRDMEKSDRKEDFSSNKQRIKMLNRSFCASQPKLIEKIEELKSHVEYDYTRAPAYVKAVENMKNDANLYSLWYHQFHKANTLPYNTQQVITLPSEQHKDFKKYIQSQITGDGLDTMFFHSQIIETLICEYMQYLIDQLNLESKGMHVSIKHTHLMDDFHGVDAVLDITRSDRWETLQRIYIDFKSKRNTYGKMNTREKKPMFASYANLFPEEEHLDFNNIPPEYQELLQPSQIHIVHIPQEFSLYMFHKYTETLTKKRNVPRGMYMNKTIRYKTFRDQIFEDKDFKQGIDQYLQSREGKILHHKSPEKFFYDILEQLISITDDSPSYHIAQKETTKSITNLNQNEPSHRVQVRSQ